MTFLELVQALHREVGAAGSAPTTVVMTNLSGEAKRLVGWVKQANLDIQNMYENWKFLRETDSRTLTTSVNTLAAPSGMGRGMWDMDTFQITEFGETEAQDLLAAEYEDVKTETVDTDTGVPWRAVIMPDNSLRFEGTPSAAHTFAADYYREPDADELAANSDTSSIPARFHTVILAKAIILYANFENATEMRVQGEDLLLGARNAFGYREGGWLARLENNQLPNQRHARFRTGGHFVVRPE